MIYSEYNNRISFAYYRGTTEDLVSIQMELLNRRQQLGEFVDKYLDKFDYRMPTASSNDPIWKLFRQKHFEYGEVEQLLRNVNYFLNK